MGKQNLYDDDGIHVPLIFAGKVNEGGKRIPAYSYLQSGVVLRGEGRRNFGSLLIFNHPQGAGMTMGSKSDDDEFSSMMGVEGLRITSNYDTAAVSQANSAAGADAAGNPGAFHVAVPGKSGGISSPL